MEFMLQVFMNTNEKKKNFGLYSLAPYTDVLSTKNKKKKIIFCNSKKFTNTRKNIMTDNY